MNKALVIKGFQPKSWYHSCMMYLSSAILEWNRLILIRM